MGIPLKLIAQAFFIAPVIALIFVQMSWNTKPMPKAAKPYHQIVL